MTITATIDEHGCLLLKADTSLEAYALQQWSSMRKRSKSSIEIQYKHPGYEDGFQEIDSILKKEAAAFRQWRTSQTASEGSK